MLSFLISKNRDALLPQRCSCRAVGCFVVAAFVLSSMVSCILLEEDTRVTIDGKNPPTFKMNGTGHQISLAVREIRPDNRVADPYRKPSPRLWEIVPSKGTPDEVWLWPKITYGQVPPSFTQKFPLEGSPAPLIEGNVYSVGGEAYNANGVQIWFTIHDGRSVEVPKPGAR